MPRATHWRHLVVAIWLLAGAACTGSNPLFSGDPSDAGDGRPGDAGPKPSDASDAPAETGAADAPGEVDAADAPGGDDTADSPAEANASDVPGLGGLGAACTTPGACQSGFCVDGVCCASDCRERCRSCALAGSAGTCTLIPSGADPRAECPAQDPATCGRAGGCDGRGDCQLHPVDTECRARTCSAGVEISAGRCNGTGVCNAGTPTACSLAECSGDRCSVGCTTTSCPSGFQCQGGRCIAGGPALHWRFDETSGTTAVDSSPNGFTGIYRGEGALPTPSTSVPPRISFPNPRSLAFGATGRPGVQLTAITSVLRPTSAVTISFWYRATAVPAGGADPVNLGSDYFIRVKASEIEMAKRRSDISGMYYQLATARNMVGHLDGNWHHLAGVISATSVNLYYDGNLRVSRANSDPILYRGADLWAGREGASRDRDFHGGLDDVRIYTRDLSLPEIQQLAAGAP